jgi:hypothetical protein
MNKIIDITLSRDSIINSSLVHSMCLFCEYPGPFWIQMDYCIFPPPQSTITKGGINLIKAKGWVKSLFNIHMKTYNESCPVEVPFLGQGPFIFRSRCTFSFKKWFWLIGCPVPIAFYSCSKLLYYIQYTYWVILLFEQWMFNAMLYAPPSQPSHPFGTWNKFFWSKHNSKSQILIRWGISFHEYQFRQCNALTQRMNVFKSSNQKVRNRSIVLNQSLEYQYLHVLCFGFLFLKRLMIEDNWLTLTRWRCWCKNDYEILRFLFNFTTKTIAIAFPFLWCAP